MLSLFSFRADAALTIKNVSCQRRSTIKRNEHRNTLHNTHTHKVVLHRRPNGVSSNSSKRCKQLNKKKKGKEREKNEKEKKINVDNEQQQR